MTRKDYIRIAAALKEAKAKIRQVEDADSVEDLIDGVDYAVGYIAETLLLDNPAFDAEKFMAAVGA